MIAFASGRASFWDYLRVKRVLEAVLALLLQSDIVIKKVMVVFFLELVLHLYSHPKEFYHGPELA